MLVAVDVCVDVIVATVSVTSAVAMVVVRVTVATVVVMVRVETVVVAVVVEAVVVLVEVAAVAVAVVMGRGKLDVQKDEAAAKPAMGEATRAGRPPAHKVLGEAAEAATLDRMAAQKTRAERGGMMLRGIRSRTRSRERMQGQRRRRRACRLYNGRARECDGAGKRHQLGQARAWR